MKLWYVKTSGNDSIIGEAVSNPSYARTMLLRPMLIRIQEFIQQPSVVANGGAPRRMKQFEVTPLPVRQIELFGVCYVGEIRYVDPVGILYQQTKKAIEELEGSPLVVEQ